MNLAMPFAGEALPLLRAMMSVAMADGVLDDRERALLDFCARLYRADVVVEELEPIDPTALAAQLDDVEQRRRLLQQLVVMAMTDEEVHPNELATLQGFAAALEVEEPLLETLRLLVDGHKRRMAFDMMRKSFIAKHFQEVRAHEGLGAYWRIGKAFAGLADAETAARYQALGAMPGGTLGRAYFEHCRAHGYPLPGERGGAPEAMIFHDLGHALTGYTTDPAGEMQMAAFEAGYMGEDGFSVTVFALLLFHLGQELGTDARPERGFFDPERWQAAFERGRRMLVDLRRWDPNPHWLKPVPQVRTELGVGAA
ncbi:MAG: hypothetical protein H6739_27180 [Alphaproteobacteria bacterium]|nr:hypothetical protein [Alphaproteobacteria bacterium]